MKRAIKRVMFYLVCGLVMTWLVAWGLAMLPRLTGPGFMSETSIYAIQRLIDKDEKIVIKRDPSQSPFSNNNNVILPEDAILSVLDTRWVGVQEVEFRIFDSSSPPREGVSAWFLLRPWWTLTANQQQWIYGRNQWNRLRAEFHSDSQRIDSHRFAILRYGFPFISHEAHTAYRKYSSPTDRQKELHATGIFIGILPSPNHAFRHSVYVPFAKLVFLPYHPLWQGMIYNTLIYALIFFILTSTKRAFRHARRLRKGKCPICCYDLQFDNTLGCPECGWRKVSGAHA